MRSPFRRNDPALPDTLTIGERVVPVLIVRHPRTRRLTLRADAIGGVIRITVPARARLADAQALLDAHRGWIAARVAAWPWPLPLVPEARVPFDGGELQLDWSPQYPRGVMRDGATLRLGGSAATVPGRTLRWLRAEALHSLELPTRALATRLDRPLARVAVRDPAARWGSCTGGSAPAIGYSWRLILAPEWVRHSVVAHEAAHLVHPNHGTAFWQLATELNGGDPAPARAWLAKHGAALHWVGRGG